MNTVGQGRVFYEALGHHESIYYNNPDMLAHILAGMQCVLGDLRRTTLRTGKSPRRTPLRGN